MSANRINPRLYFFVRGLVNLLFTLLTHRQVSGLENVPKQEPYLIVTNHLSAFDPPLIMATLPLPITVFAASTHRSDFLIGELMNQLGAIWVRRGEADRQALRTAIEALKAGHIVGVAPEGTRSKTGALQAGKVGAAYLATRANVTLLPVVVTGTEMIAPTLKRLRRPRVAVTIGEPFRLPASGHAGAAELEIYTDQIMRILAAMLPEKYRGVYR
jgi:1-acyl-sn-glycerol-3-phosphate acyltransferase